ncbi:hypothetical protein FVE85_6564 [Porphyridium purpureum]|uniref:Uncharacterized protein n=1 Tax=Porphyridium purpureum TaxID=35688 RepID=A0A5J4Z4P8_PORPP|nr:hypothetical protein FVE85_6564 [Porphyridium purpureum]|eukprot:POR5156..scf295_1
MPRQHEQEHAELLKDKAVVRIDRYNADQVLPLLDKQIQQATFVSISAAIAARSALRKSKSRAPGVPAAEPAPSSSVHGQASVENSTAYPASGKPAARARHGTADAQRASADASPKVTCNDLDADVIDDGDGGSGSDDVDDDTVNTGAHHSGLTPSTSFSSSVFDSEVTHSSSMSLVESSTTHKRLQQFARDLRAEAGILELSISVFRRMHPKQQREHTREFSGEGTNGSSAAPLRHGSASSRASTTVRYAMKTFTILFCPLNQYAYMNSLKHLLRRGVSVEHALTRGIPYLVPSMPSASTPAGTVKDSSRMTPDTDNSFLWPSPSTDMIVSSTSNGRASHSRDSARYQHASSSVYSEVRERMSSTVEQSMAKSASGVWNWNSDVLDPFPEVQGVGARVIKMIRKSRVPVVVFDGLEELALLRHAFYAPQPDEWISQLVLYPQNHHTTQYVEACITQAIARTFPRVIDARYVAESHFREEQSSTLDALFSKYSGMSVTDLHAPPPIRKEKGMGPHAAQQRQNSRGPESEPPPSSARVYPSVSPSSPPLDTVSKNEGGLPPSVMPSTGAGNAGTAAVHAIESMSEEDMIKVFENRVEEILQDSFDSPMTSVHQGTYFLPGQGLYSTVEESFPQPPHVSAFGPGASIVRPTSGFKPSPSMDALKMQLKAVVEKSTRPAFTGRVRISSSAQDQLTRLLAEIEHREEEANPASGKGLLAGQVISMDAYPNTSTENSDDDDGMEWPSDMINPENELGKVLSVTISKGTSMLDLAERRGSQHGSDYFRSRYLSRPQHSVSFNFQEFPQPQVPSDVQGETGRVEHSGSACAGTARAEANAVYTGSGQDAFELGALFASFAERVGWKNVLELFEGFLFRGVSEPPLSLRTCRGRSASNELAAPLSRQPQQHLEGAFVSDAGMEKAANPNSASLFSSSHLQPGLGVGVGRAGSEMGAMSSVGASANGVIQGAAGFPDKLSSSSIRMGYLSRLGLHQPPFSPRSFSADAAGIERMQLSDAEDIDESIASRRMRDNSSGMSNNFSQANRSSQKERLRSSPAAVHLVDRLVDLIMPNQFLEVLRVAVFEYTAAVVKAALNGQTFCFGGFAYKCYLADSTLDVGVFLVAGSGSGSGAGAGAGARGRGRGRGRAGVRGTESP